MSLLETLGHVKINLYLVHHILFVQTQWCSYSTPVNLSGPEFLPHLSRRNTYPPYSSTVPISHYNNMVIFQIARVCYTCSLTLIYCSFQYSTMHNQGDDDGSSFTSISEVITKSIMDSSKVINLSYKYCCVTA